MATLSSLAIDPEIARFGVWFDYAMGVRFRIARANNDAATRAITVMVAEEKKAGRVIDAARLQEIATECTAAHILRDWSGIDGDDGRPVPYSIAAALDVLRDPQYADVRTFVDEASRDLQTFRAATVAARNNASKGDV